MKGLGRSLSKLLVLSLAASALGCTSMQQVELPPEELQAQIRQGTLIQPGDRVRLVTEDEQEYRFEVTSVDRQSIGGDGIRIPIDEVIAVRTRELSTGKTALLAAGTAGTIYLVILGISSAAILAAAAP